MNLMEKINVKNVNIDIITGEVLSNKEVYRRAIEFLGGIQEIIPLIPFSLEEIREALKQDIKLNNLSEEKWNNASGFYFEYGKCYPIGTGMWKLYRKFGIDSANCAEGVSILKEVARQWVEINNKNIEEK